MLILAKMVLHHFTLYACDDIMMRDGRERLRDIAVLNVLSSIVLLTVFFLVVSI